MGPNCLDFQGGSGPARSAADFIVVSAKEPVSKPVPLRTGTKMYNSQMSTLSRGALSAFGLFAVTAMLVCYALERRSRWFVLGFAASCLLGSVYGFLQGAWPFGLVEAVWSVVAVRRWWLLGREGFEPS